MFNCTQADKYIDSSAVAEVYYNENNGELAVVLQSGDAYVYQNVSRDIYEQFVEAASPGRFYARILKPNFGPGESLGYVGFDSDEFVNLNSIGQFVPTTGTPKNLTYATDAVVHNITTNASPGNYTTLEVKPTLEMRKHTVVFDANGADRTHALHAESVNDAVNQIQEFADALGVTFKVKAVTVHFE